jgi:hypothetical protein
MREQVTFSRDNKDDDRFVLDHHAYLDLYSTRSPKQQSASSIRTHYLDSEPTNLCSFSLVLRDYQRRTKYQFCILWFDPTGTRTHDLSNSLPPR